MGKKLGVVLARVLNVPLYLLTRVTPRDPQLWVFGAWFGRQFADNPRYLAEYITSNRPDIHVVWLSDSDDAIVEARRSGLTACRKFSLRGYLATARAGAGVVCTSSWDINHFVRPRVVLNTWHGTPLKKVGLDDEKRTISPMYRLLERAIPMFRRGSYPLLVASKLEQKIMESAFRQSSCRIHITGFPRNDVLTQRPIRTEGLKIVYMPTHRGEGKDELVPLLKKAAPAIEQRLERLGATLYVKLHYYHMHEVVDFASERIVPVLDRPASFDTQRFLDDMDVLITDYSSVIFDWLLTDRPLVLLPYDLDVYRRNDREFYWDYESVAPGPQCQNWNEVLSVLDDIAASASEWEARRALVRARFHAATDQGASARVVTLLERMIADAKV